MGSAQHRPPHIKRQTDVLLPVEAEGIDHLPAQLLGVGLGRDGVHLVDEGDGDGELLHELDPHFLEELVQQAGAPIRNVDTDRAVLEAVLRGDGAALEAQLRKAGDHEVEDLPLLEIGPRSSEGIGDEDTLGIGGNEDPVLLDHFLDLLRGERCSDKAPLPLVFILVPVQVLLLQGQDAGDVSGGAYAGFDHGGRHCVERTEEYGHESERSRQGGGIHFNSPNVF